MPRSFQHSHRPKVQSTTTPFNRSFFKAIKMLDPLTDLRGQLRAIDHARAQVAAAETVVRIAKEKSRTAKRERKVARDAARQAKKRLKKAKKKLVKARRVLECAEENVALESERAAVKQKTGKPKKAKARAYKKNALKKRTQIEEGASSSVNAALANENPVEEFVATAVEPAQENLAQSG